jgi:predicted O-methyltransferase YrrM
MAARASRLAPELRWALQLRALPWRVALFHLRARRLAARCGDGFGPDAATRPAKLAELVRLSRGRGHVVELGTAGGWTAVSLLLADRHCRVTSFDPFVHAYRDRYLALAPAHVRERLTCLQAPGSAGPPDPTPVELLYIDSSHEREETVRELVAWQPVLAPGAVVVFDDYNHPDYPGVRAAIEELGLPGEMRAGLFVHQR